MTLELRPLGNRVVVEPIEEDEVTPGGIVLPETAKEKPQQGKVLAVGPGERDEKGQRIPLDVKVGDRVLFEGKKLLILRESDILAVVDEK